MPFPDLDVNGDGVVDPNDTSLAYEQISSDGYVTSEEESWLYQIWNTTGIGSPGMLTNLQDGIALLNQASGFSSDADFYASNQPDVSQVSGGQSIQASQQNLGMSAGSTGNRAELGRMLESYKGRTSLIQAPQRQKAIYTIDRFDGGLNLNKSPRDISYWEACQMDCMSPARVGRLTRLGDFATKIAASSANGLELFQAGSTAVIEGYGLHYFIWSDSIDASEAFAGETPTNYIATMDGGDVNIWNLDNSAGTNDTATDDLIVTMHASTKAVYHDAPNRLYVSDASFSSSNTYVCGIVDRPNYYPFDNSGTTVYNVTGSTGNALIKDRTLVQAPPVAGIEAAGDICFTRNSAGAAAAGTGHQGIYINAVFADMTGEVSGIGWGGDIASAPKHYKFFASFLYDNGSETKLTDVTGTNNTDADIGAAANIFTATTTAATVYQALEIRQIIIDAPSFYETDSLKRIHGARLYYTETDSTGAIIGDDKYLFAELDFRYGFKLMSEFGHWNLFENEDADGTTPNATELQSVQVKGAANDVDADLGDTATLTLKNPPTAFTYYALNLFHQEELKEDLMWKTSTVGNGIAFIGNVKYDNSEYPTTMIYSGAGETDAGSAYPMWGTFPVDSNRIDIPGDGGSITALKWTKGKVLQFRKNSLYIVNVENVLAPVVEGVYQGMGVHGQYAVTETSYGVAWVNDTGVYSYNAEEGKARSLTIGRIDTEDFQANSPHANTKIGYDDRAKMLIVTNATKYDTAGYHYAYSFITDAWCTWNGNKAHASNVTTNFAIDHDGYLTGAIEADGQDQGGGTGTTLHIYKWSTTPTSTPTIDYITKDIDMGKPSLDKRLYTLYISYIGGASNEINVYFRVNGREGNDLTSNWVQLGTVFDFTDPYADSTGNAWDTSGSPITGDPYVPSADDGLDSADTGEQKLAKINLRTLAGGSFPVDYFKFARSIQLRFTGVAAITFEINDISLVYKEKRLK